MGDQNEASSTPAGVPAGSSSTPNAGVVAPANPAAPVATPEDQTASRSKAFEAAEHWKSQAAAEAKARAEAEAKLKAIEDKRLADEGNFREIAQREAEARKAAEERAKTLEAEHQAEKRNNALFVEASKIGLRPEKAGILKLADPNLAPAEAAAALKASYAPLFGPTDPKTNNTTVSPAPAGGNKPFDPSKVKTADEIREISSDPDKTRWEAYKAWRERQRTGGHGNPWLD